MAADDQPVRLIVKQNDLTFKKDVAETKEIIESNINSFIGLPAVFLQQCLYSQAERIFPDLISSSSISIV
jgi:hypothetical protein